MIHSASTFSCNLPFARSASVFGASEKGSHLQNSAGVCTHIPVPSVRNLTDFVKKPYTFRTSYLFK